MEVRPMKRICPSVIEMTRVNISRQIRGPINGSSPSTISISAKAMNNILPMTCYFEPLPGLLKYLKKSEFGSSTRTSFFFAKPARYPSRLR